MSCIAWDGKTLAADRRGTMGSFHRLTTKIFRARGCLVGFTGDAAGGMEMLAWFDRGESPEDFPASQRGERWSGLLVIRSNTGSILKYENTPYPIYYDQQLFAMGSGCDFAMAAMYCGKTAAEAVEVACIFDAGCGGGVDTLTLD
jgi:hypothetical protein